MLFAENIFEIFANSDWLLLHCSRTLCFALILLPSNQYLGLDRNKCILDRCHLGLEVTQLEYWDFAFFISLIIQDCFIGYNCQSVLEFETWNSNVKCELWGCRVGNHRKIHVQNWLNFQSPIFLEKRTKLLPANFYFVNKKVEES